MLAYASTPRPSHSPPTPQRSACAPYAAPMNFLIDIDRHRSEAAKSLIHVHSQTKGHGAVSAARVAKRDVLRHEKYPAP
jgi:hypothetical protein